jgi:hypothetical protein
VPWLKAVNTGLAIFVSMATLYARSLCLDADVASTGVMFKKNPSALIVGSLLRKCLRIMREDVGDYAN